MVSESICTSLLWCSLNQVPKPFELHFKLLERRFINKKPDWRTDRGSLRENPAVAAAEQVAEVARRVNTLSSGGVCARVTGAQLCSSDSLRWIWLGVNYTIRLETTFWRTFPSVEATGWKSCSPRPDATSGPLLVDRFRGGNPSSRGGGG